VVAMATADYKYDLHVLEDVREGMGLEATDDSRDDEINSMSRAEVFKRYLEWNGIIGYASDIKRAIEDIYDVQLKEEERVPECTRFGIGQIRFCPRTMRHG
jgi:hypothetical protein